MMLDYTWEELTSREFEIIACNFAKSMFPNYEWQLTTLTRDDNHDFYAKSDKLYKWGEAKHSIHPDKAISRSQWDPTLVSAKLINSVNDLLLVTCAFIPLSYVVRSYQMIGEPLNNIFYVNRVILNKWYSGEPEMLSFSTDININNVLAKIKQKELNGKFNEIKIFFFDDAAQNRLINIKSFVLHNPYRVNVVIFMQDENGELKLELGDSLKIIDGISLKHLSHCSEEIKITKQKENFFKCEVQQGYSIIEFKIIVDRAMGTQNSTDIKYSLKDVEKFYTIETEDQHKYNESRLLKIETIISENDSKQNKIIKTSYFPSYLYNRPNFKFLHICFDERYYNNSTLLCRLISYMITGIDYSELDEILLKEKLYLSDYPEYLENIILGVFNDSLSNESLEFVYDKLENLFSKYERPQNMIYILENSTILKDIQKRILEKAQVIFSTYKNNSYIIYQAREMELSNNYCDDETALIGIFETGIQQENLSLGDTIKNKAVTMDINESLYFPSGTLSIRVIKDYVLQKDTTEIEMFLERIVNIVSKQKTSSRVLDFMILLRESDLDMTLYLKAIRKLRDIYYLRTDFHMAYQYSKLLCGEIKEDSEQFNEQYIDDKYKEADELNHCGSIVQSRKIFQDLAEILLRKDTSFLNKGLEALTEVFNISFWLLDVENLIQTINNTLDTYFSRGVSATLDNRGLYPYYNCLNRKMVTQYLLGQYEDAEETFKVNLDTVKLDNYKAFAYMDSARGLYYKDIYTAHKRVTNAFVILKDLHDKNKEIRRYYDCLIEKSYVEFVLATQNERPNYMRNLIDALYNVKKYGFKNIVKKCFFKLTACYLVLGDAKKASYYLEKIKSDPYFSEAPRNQLMCNELLKGYYHLINHNSLSCQKIKTDYCNIAKPIEFNCFENIHDDKLFIETRMW